MSDKPDNIVAKRVVEKLLKSKLLLENKKEEWIKKLSLGEVSAEDWNLLSDFYIEQKGQNL